MIHHIVEDRESSHRPDLKKGGQPRPSPVAPVCLTVCVFLALGGGFAVAQNPPVTGTNQPTPAAGTPAPAGTGLPTGVGTEIPPVPRPVMPFGPGAVRLPRLAAPPIGTTPQPSPEVKKEYARYVEGLIAPENTFELIQGRTHLMVLKEAPRRIQVSDETVAAYTLLSPKEISILGRAVGVTVLNLWFADANDPNKGKVLSYQVRVLPDPEAKERLERIYKALEDEINRAFKDSRVSLMLVGDKLLVCGQAKDIAEANYILQIVRTNAPNANRETVGERNARIPVERTHLVDPTEIGPDGLIPQATDSFQSSGGPNVVNLLRVVGEQQVMLQVRVAEVDRAAARSIGLNFNIFNKQGLRVVGSTVGNIVPPFGGGGFVPFQQGVGFGGLQGRNGGNLNNLPVALDYGQIQLAINALRELNYARTLAEPTLTTMNGQTANFEAGGRFPVPYVAGFTNVGLQGVNFIPVGVQLSFTPFITDRDRIRLNISAEVSERDLTLGATIINGSAVPSLTTRNFQTTVELREGQTLAVAGLIQNRLGSNSSRVPGIGDLPFIGRIASFDRIHAQEQELVILITPQLVHPLEPKQVPQLPGCDLYEPSDLEFYVLGRMESRRAYDYRSPVMNDVHRMIRYKKCEQLYIMGPHGHSRPCAVADEGEPLPVMP